MDPHSLHDLPKRIVQPDVICLANVGSPLDLLGDDPFFINSPAVIVRKLAVDTCEAPSFDNTDVDTNSSQVKQEHVKQEVSDEVGSEYQKESEGLHEAQETDVGRTIVRADFNDDAVKLVEHIAIQDKACADAARIKMFFSNRP